MRDSSVAGFSAKDAPPARLAIQRTWPSLSADSVVFDTRIVKIWLRDEQRADAFAIASQLQGLKGVRLAAADFHALGHHLRRVELPMVSANSFERRNYVDLAWSLLRPSDYYPAAGQFLGSRQQVAVIDWDFDPHTQIYFNLIGYDAADGDHNPMTPLSLTANATIMHGLLMSGVIGGVAQASNNQVGVAPGAEIIPVRPDWITSADFEGNHWTHFDETADHFLETWVDALIRMCHLALGGLETANMSFAEQSQLWEAGNVADWMDWWVTSCGYTPGVFATASAGNNPAFTTTLATPADQPHVFAAGWGDYAAATMLGSSGNGLDVVVDDGAWPFYSTNGTSVTFAGTGSGGSSVASAVVAGTAAIMKDLDISLTPTEIFDILQRTTRKAAGQAALEDASGYTTKFGWGFLDSYAAVDVARRYRRIPNSPLPITYSSALPTGVFAQQRLGPNDSYSGANSGMFWAMTPTGAADHFWVHVRDPNLSTADQAIDTWGLPFGELTGVADFDGDGTQDVVLQLHPTNFWPAFSPEPGFSFLAYHYDATQAKWVPLGGRSPNATGTASPQIVFPNNQPVDGVTVADVDGTSRRLLVSWQNNLINAVRFDLPTTMFVRANPLNYSPPLSGTRINSAMLGTTSSQRIRLVSPVGVINGRQALGCIGEVTKQIPLGTGPNIVLTRKYLTFFVLSYDPTSPAWTVVPLSGDPADTHILIESVGQNVVTDPRLLSGNFETSINPAHLSFVIDDGRGQLHYVSLHRPTPTQGFDGYSVYSRTPSTPGIVSRMVSGTFGVGVTGRQLAWLSDAAHGNVVRFLEWNEALRDWSSLLPTISHGRKDNEAIGLRVIEGVSVNGSNLSVPTLLMKRPAGNVSLTYVWDGATAKFKSLGAF
ncbi:MAG: S8/S53 family peptidase [Gemmatimonadaceae bacterium]